MVLTAGEDGGFGIGGVTDLGPSNGISLNDLFKNIGNTINSAASAGAAASQPQINLADYYNPGSGSGSGGSTFNPSTPENDPLGWHNAQADDAQRALDNTYRDSLFNYNKSKDDRDYALAVGDQALAQQKQKDMNYWNGKTIEAENARNAADNAARIQTANIGAQAQVQSASIAAAADRYAAGLRAQADMANATNDQERNRISLAHEKELAAIAKMEDDTKRQIAGRDQNIAGFNAETTRQYQMGDLALKNNQFIADMAKSPRDLFGLYFMQRGMTPDWNQLGPGGTMPQGDPLLVHDPMKAYVPNVTLPQDWNLNPGASYGNVGSGSGISLANNPFINMNGVSSAGSAPPPDMTFTGSGIPATYPVAGQPPVNIPIDNGDQGGQVNLPYRVTTPVARSWTGTDFPIRRYAAGSDFNMASWLSPQGGNLQKLNSMMADFGTQQKGYTTAGKLMTGDAPTQDPFAGGARPEMIENPTNAPIRVKNTMQTAADFGVQRQALGTDNSGAYNDLGLGQLWMNSSNNDYLSGYGQLPQKLQGLADYGAPIAPSLANSVTGRGMGTLNLGNAFQGRGGGALPSLQSLNQMAPGEMDLFRGYAEGVAGIPWADIVDYLGKSTANLGSAKRSVGGMM